MTVEPEALPKKSSASSLKEKKDISVLEDIFTLGFTKSDPITVFENADQGLEINVVFRTVTPSELIDVYEAAGNYSTLFAQKVSERIETLARSIQFINKSPLILSGSDQTEYLKRLGRPEESVLSPLEQAKIIIAEKIKSPIVIDALWEAYEKFRDSVIDSVKDLKKK